MNEKPILFSSEMVRAILEGRKTQTRRVIKPQPTEPSVIKQSGAGIVVFDHSKMTCPYGMQGDHLWVRETFMYDGADVRPASGKFDNRVIYRASNPEYGEAFKWKPSIHMPRWASRITLEIVKVRVERVQDITGEDARTEGCIEIVSNGWVQKPTALFAQLWDSINSKRGFPWAWNPWIWVIEFKRAK